MSLATVAVANGILAVTVIAALAYVCRIPYRAWPYLGTKESPLRAGEEGRPSSSVDERFAA